MIQQRVGDLLEIRYENRFSYIVVLTKIVLFGGNIVFAYHTDGKKHGLDYLLDHNAGFNVCTDLLWAKKSGDVSRLHQFENIKPFWRTEFIKGTNEHRLGVKAKVWYIYEISNPLKIVAKVTKLTPKYCKAMDRSTHSFDLVVKMIEKRYTPDQNEHI